MLKATVKQVLKAATGMLTRTYSGKELAERRLNICFSCLSLRQKGFLKPECSLCRQFVADKVKIKTERCPAKPAKW
jgi:hypothetical protein